MTERAPVAAPRASVVLVTHNAWDLTGAALAAVRRHTHEPYEVVAVDNGSEDGTPDRLAADGGVRLIRNAVNAGFGAAANQGIAAARAPYAVLLNSDAFVHPGWLRPLLDVVHAELDVAVVGSRLLHPDGRLQEAGSVLWREGLVGNYGDGDDPSHGRYLFRRDVEHLSAACVLVRRSAVLDAGGFDPVYAPAYFEDADLLMRLRDGGWRCVYQPRSTATHVRWGSGSEAATARLFERNQPVFRDRWRARLRELPPRPPADAGYWRALAAARDHSAVERLLAVSDHPPTGRSAEDARFAALLTGMARLWPSARVTLLAGEEGRWELGVGEPLLAAGVEVLAGPGAADEAVRVRRGHWSAVLTRTACPPDPDLDAAIAAAQPAALRVLDIGAHTEPPAPAVTPDLVLYTETEQRAAAWRLAPGGAAVYLPQPDGDEWWDALVEAASHLGMAPPRG